jgi:hypothetical protein
MFAGLSAFPLTPMDDCGIDEAAFVGLVARERATRRRRSRRRTGSADSGSSSRHTAACASWPPAAAQLGLTQQVNLPRPLRRLDGAGRERLAQTLTALASPR